VEAIYAYLRNRDGNALAVLPTAAGKSLILAQLCSDAVGLWNGRVCVLSHVRELLEQTGDKIQRMAPSLPMGFYSAGMNRRDMQQSVLLCQIQSVYKRAGELCDDKPFDLILIDEVHLVGESDEGMFTTFLADMKIINPSLRVIGLTATPFRMKSGLICGPDRLFSEVCYEVGVRELIVDGYLCPLKTKAGRQKVDTSGLHLRGGEFIATEVETLMDDAELVQAACDEIVQMTADRRSVLIFAAGIQHGLHVQKILQERHGVECGFVCGETPSHQRDELLARFRGLPSDQLFGENRDKPLKFLCNVNVLTTGFDAPNIDAVVLLRPTMSAGLFYQMVGRGFRLHPSKTDCLVLDFGGNILRHGPVDMLQIKQPGDGTGEAPAKECPKCQTVVHAAYSVCPECGYRFPPPEREKHDSTAATTGILSGQVEENAVLVTGVTYRVHAKQGAPDDAPRTLRVEYRIGWNKYISEWICLEHTGYARNKAEAWWRQRSNDPVPNNIEDAVAICNAGGVADTTAVTVRHVAGEKFDRIVNYQLGPVPPPVTSDLGGLEPRHVPIAPDDDIPF